MRFNDFVKKYLGKTTDFDGAYGVQCVDLAKLYIDKVIGVVPQSIGNAHAYWDNFKQTYLKKYFKAIPYKKGVKAKKGDLVVWGKYYNGKSEHGHIAIATGKQTDTTITTYDQNWGGSQMKEVVHSLDGVKGFLRPLNQENIINKPTVNAGDVVKLTNANVLYKNANKKAFLLVSDVSNFKCDTRAQMKKGTKLNVIAVDTVKGNVWLKIKVNGIECYVIAYDKKKDKCYIK